MNEDGAVGFRVACQIFLPCGVFNDFAVFSEDLDFVAIVRRKVVVKSLAVDSAAHAVLSILPEKQNDFPVEIEFLHPVGEFQSVPLKRPADTLTDERRERAKIRSDAGAIESGEIRLAVPQANDRPRITA